MSFKLQVGQTYSRADGRKVTIVSVRQSQPDEYNLPIGSPIYLGNDGWDYSTDGRWVFALAIGLDVPQLNLRPLLANNSGWIRVRRRRICGSFV